MITYTLSPDFQFSQSNLYDFETCSYRFKLRYVDNLKWPAVEAEPIQEAELLAKLGTDFHLLVQQHLHYQQLPQADQAEMALEAMLVGDESHKLREWWQNYLCHPPAILQNATIYPELTFSTPLRGYRLTARFDVLAISPDGTFWIIDWKTSQRKPARQRLENHPQTLVYRYVLAMAGSPTLALPLKGGGLGGGEKWGISPDNIKMMYWYPAAPTEAEIFSYGPQLFEAHERRLSNLIEQIKDAVQNNNFPLTEDSRPCQYCVYRSLCKRGIKAGPLVEMETEAQAGLNISAFDWEQIAEIQF